MTMQRQVGVAVWQIAVAWFCCNAAGLGECRADCLAGNTGWTVPWKIIKKEAYSLRINSAGEAAIQFAGQGELSLPGVLFFSGGKSLSMHNDLHGTGAWSAVTGTITEEPDATVITIVGEVLDLRIRQVIRAGTRSLTWHWNAETFDPTPEMRWFRFEGAFFNCAGLPFTAWLKDGAVIRGVLGTEFQPLKNVSALAVRAPAGQIRIEWPAADRVGVTHNPQPPHIPARYNCSAAQGAALGDLLPGDKFECSIKVTMTPAAGGKPMAKATTTSVK